MMYNYCEEQRPSTPSSQLLTSHETKKESIVDIPECQESHTLTLAAQFATSTPGQVEEKENCGSSSSSDRGKSRD